MLTLFQIPQIFLVGHITHIQIPNDPKTKMLNNKMDSSSRVSQGTEWISAVVKVMGSL
jgi:hypothetical protein